MIRARSTLLVGLSSLLLLASCREPLPVRVVVVTLDTLRYDALDPDRAPDGAAADGGESSMPLLLARAREGALFERFYAATSVTQPSHASMFTALHPWEHGVVSNGQVLDERFDTVAEVLRGEGFATAAVVASFPVAARFGFAQGFDSFDDRFTEGRLPRRRWEGHAVTGAFYSLADTVTERALMHLGSPGRDPETGRPRDQFLWVHYFDPHDPYGDTGGGPSHPLRAARRAIEAGRDVAPVLAAFREAYAR
ncbi:MAG TPA: sulfatase-like hydrolase/transferase, partial [Thermoanaerobaculia bacterium]|nr:sulfatase-like hydrolase/transferase [Thermoanaerobaculia bacterium]